MMNWTSKLKSVKGTEFEKSKYQPVEPRKRFVDNVKAQITLFQNPDAKTTVKPTFVRGEKDGVRFTLRFGTKAIDLKRDGSDTAYVLPEDEFVSVLREIVAAAEDGAFDNQLDAISQAMSNQLRSAREFKSTATA